MTEDAESSSVPAADAFGALASEHRIAVLRTFADAERDGERTLSFTEIYDALDIDSTSQLSYHLDHLEGVFLRRSESGYELNRAGEDVMRAVLAGSFTETPSFEPLALSGECPGCPETAFDATEEDGLLTVRCDGCGMRIVTYDLPPAAVVGRSERAVLEACDRRVRHEYAVAVGGTCANCGGRAVVSVEQRESHGETDPYAVAVCERCNHRVFAPVAAHVLFHPAVVAFYWRHGVDATAIAFWDLPRYIEAWDVDVAEVESNDPPMSADRSPSTEPSVSVTVRYGGESLALSLDADLTVSVVGTDGSGNGG
ncbi:helix-turn-helix transcriptional regulator [Halorubellus sp. JP-L1]|uniref:ArsR/SmtB family transcription factor n=1 Tax=Halorubellus sp. JP-L1 TaxID=2715753 RepID=UPI00140CB877|nr:helix-turn-helix domain-containing protein [Halorubellus sp. JP-L1]NHN43094.1 helix-turn-helix transcriptional regulator [Halorubellus sp. JP-L1]